MFDLKDLTPEHFQPLLETSLPINDSEHSLRIDAVELINSPSPRAQPFSVTFSAPPDQTGSQGIYHLIHPELGVLELFLVPLELKNGVLRFEATFN